MHPVCMLVSSLLMASLNSANHLSVAGRVFMMTWTNIVELFLQFFFLVSRYVAWHGSRKGISSVKVFAEDVVDFEAELHEVDAESLYSGW